MVLSNNYRISLGKADWVTGRQMWECREESGQQHIKCICRLHDKWKRDLGSKTRGKRREGGPKKISQEPEAEVSFSHRLS